MIANLVLILISVFMVIAISNSPEKPAGLVFFIVVFVVGTLLWVFRYAIQSALSALRIRKLDRSVAEADKQAAEAEKKQHEEKQAQIASLPPVQRMTARIETNAQSVSLYLQLSEKERATVIQYDLDQIVFEDYPKWDKAEIAESKRRGEEELDAIRGHSEQKMLHREIVKQANVAHIESMKTERQQVRFIDYMAYPYTRYFKTTPEATQYAAKLKQLLPKIKELVDQHATHKASETIEL